MSDRIELTPAEVEAAAEAAYIAHELAVRGDGKYAPWVADWSQPKWRGSIVAAVYAVNKVRADNEAFRSFVRDLKRVTNGHLTYDDQARDLMLSYDITPKGVS
jgi:hypothetical protein